MEKGAKAILFILLFALVTGALVTWWHPAFSESWRALREGRPEASPIWISNADYYPEIAIDSGEAVRHAE
jgi:hypothetical protein